MMRPCMGQLGKTLGGHYGTYAWWGQERVWVTRRGVGNVRLLPSYAFLSYAPFTRLLGETRPVDLIATCLLW